MARVRARLLVVASLLALIALTAAACDDGGVRVLGEDGIATAAGTATTIATGAATRSATAAATRTAAPDAPPAPGELRLVEAFGGLAFERPVELGVYPVGAEPGSSLFVAEQDGRVVVLRDVLGGGAPGGEQLLLDISGQVARRGDEEGLLSVAVDPLFTENGHLWVYYSVAGAPRLTRLSRFRVDLAADPFRADPGSELVIMEVEQPFPNHNGGAIRFGPDGMLYLGFGDGGSGDDPLGNGQNLGTLLGSIIRIDVRDASPGAPYVVATDNPFIGVAGAREEIWAYGLRNPWRMAFDWDGGALWLGDVGQGAREEIDVIERGANYGWNRLGGSRCFDPPRGCNAVGTVPPVAEYSHELGCSVTGGVVYRGEDAPSLVGSYLFADFCSARVWALPVAGGEAVEVARSPREVASFGADLRGEVYLLTFGGPILRIAP